MSLGVRNWGVPSGMDPIHCVVPGASWYLASERRTRIPLLPQLPPPPNGARERWPIDAGAPRKSHGRLRRTARTNPSTAFPPSLENRRNGRRFSTAPTDRRRSVACCRSLLSALPNGPNDLWSHGCGSDRLRSLPPSTFHATRDIPARLDKVSTRRLSSKGWRRSSNGELAGANSRTSHGSWVPIGRVAVARRSTLPAPGSAARLMGTDSRQRVRTTFTRSETPHPVGCFILVRQGGDSELGA